MAANRIVSVQAFKDATGKGQGSTTQDGLIGEYLDAASTEIENATRRVLRREALVAQPHDGTGSRLLVLQRPPVVSLASIVVRDDLGTTIATLGPSHVDIVAPAEHSNGRIRLRATAPIAAFPRGQGNILVSYTGGFDPIPAPLAIACRRLALRHLLAEPRDPSVVRESAGRGAHQERTTAEIPPEIWALMGDYVLMLHRAVSPSAPPPELAEAVSA